LAETFGLEAPPPLDNITWQLTGGDNVFDGDFKRWSRAGARLWETMRKSPERALVAAVKNCLIAADVAGSALPKARPDDPARWDWIATSFADRPEPGALQSVVDHKLTGKLPRAFQTAVAESGARVTYVKAGCGSGKTLAAYMWAARNHPTRRLYFCYPTTGTATEGF
jgi:CRISPR-associated endonuclease/helicase Cas3